ncbi:dynamin family protein [Paenibacillus oryzisoli]|uniref:dynamin family protein n=1 Tax=Paenibacillus oryzisoli TaxID=1850517 RepID=UPI003D2DD2D0
MSKHSLFYYQACRHHLSDLDIRKAKDEWRRSYYICLYALLKNQVPDDPCFLEAMSWYAVLLGIPQDEQDSIQANIQSSNAIDKKQLKNIGRSYIQFANLLPQIRTYKYLFFANVLMLLPDPKPFLQSAAGLQTVKELRLQKKTVENITEFVTAIREGRFDAQKEWLSKKSYRSLRAFLQQQQDIRAADQRRFRRIALVAPMSAGKSSFINALVGEELLPVRNEACTAKITEISHNPSLDRFIGIVEGTGNPLAACLTRSRVDEWNRCAEGKVVRIEGNLGLGTDDTSVTLIDTPGPNSSTYEEHEKITFDFLEQGHFDAVLYLINATQVATNDDKQLLQGVLRKLGTGKKIIFIVNKADQIDIDSNESLGGLLDTVFRYLQNVGVEKPTVIPSSAYAAHLLQSVMNKKPMTRKEKSDVDWIYATFADHRYDLNTYTLHADDLLTEAVSEAAGKSSIAPELKNSSPDDISIAFHRTGIPLVRRLFQSL